MVEFPEEVTECQIARALRFDGYAYENRNGPDPEATGAVLQRLAEPIIASLTLHQDQEQNFAAFFGLQRFLFKWGGEYLTKYTDEHLAFDFLFLHLYGAETPPAYVFEEYETKWVREYRPRAEAAAAIVRQSFKRRGRGPKTYW